LLGLKRCSIVSPILANKLPRNWVRYGRPNTEQWKCFMLSLSTRARKACARIIYTVPLGDPSNTRKDSSLPQQGDLTSRNPLRKTCENCATQELLTMQSDRNVHIRQICMRTRGEYLRDNRDACEHRTEGQDLPLAIRREEDEWPL